jgi:molybdate transport system substrate-binding protein
MPLPAARRLSALIIATVIVTGLFGAPGLQARDPAIVAAASDLQFALAEAAEAYRRITGDAVKVSFGSSGNFYRQIRQGAPYDIYMSADESFVLDLAGDGLTLDRGALYAIGRIVIIAPEGSPLEADSELNGLRAALAEGRIEKFAIPNPEHAPYGGRAEEALRHAGLWQALAAKLVLGENVSQAAQFATSGSTQGGIIAYSLALSPKLSARGRFALIPQAWHRPLRQRMVLLKQAGHGARAFYDFILGPAGRAILARHGFAAPDETP